MLASLVVVGVVGNAVNANAAYTTACSGATDTHFTDHPGTAANCLFDYGIALGKANGTFGENDPLIRAQFASFVTRFLDAAGVPHTARTPFPDVNTNSVPDANVLQEIEEGHAAGVVNGYSAQSKEVVNGDTCVGTGQPCQPGDFGPEHNMSVAQACTIVLNMMDAIHAANPAAPAGNATGDPATDYDACVANGILDLNAKDASGATYPNGKSDTVQRGLFADMLAQALQKEVDAGVIPNAYTSSNGTFISDTTANPTVVTFSPTSAGGSGLKTKTITFTHVGTDDVSVALLPCAGDNGAAGFVYMTGGTTFRDLDRQNPNNTPDNKADAVGIPGWRATSPVSGFVPPGFDNAGGTDGALQILSVNGDPQPNGGYDANITPDSANGGTIAVAVSNFTNDGDCAQVLVFQDTNSDDALNLDSANKANELFGVSGPVVWTGGEAPSGSSGGDVVFYDAVNHIMYTDDTNGVFYKIRSNDSPFYDEQVQGNGAFPITVAQFEQYISSGDNFDFQSGGYSASGGNQFLQEYDFGQTPKGVSATQGDFDNDAGAAPDDVKLTIGTLPTDVLIDHICAYRDGAGINNQVTGTNCTANGTGSAVTSIVDSNPGPGTFHYRVSVVGQADDESDWSEPVTVTVTTPVGPVAGAPLSDSAVHTDGNSDGIVNDGDILINTFNETMNAPAADAQLGVCDGDGTCGLFQNGVNATFSKVAANRIVVIVGSAGPVIVSNGGNGTLDYASGPCLGFGPNGVCAVNLPAPADTHGYTDTDENLEWTDANNPPLMDGADVGY